MIPLAIIAIYGIAIYLAALATIIGAYIGFLHWVTGRGTWTGD